ncbi:MAG: nuclear transport factor 2 family protein [Chloroflexota bacterium]
MTVSGKGYYLWKILNCEGGNVESIARLAQEAQLSHLLLKIADGVNPYNYDRNVDLLPPLVQTLRKKGIQAWGWHYVYGDNPLSEARIAIQRIEDLGLDGYVIDAEEQYKQPGKDTAAKRFMRELRVSLPDFPIALSSYRYPSYHPQLPWSQFLEKCDINMPQVYWMFANNPGAQLNRCVREFKGMSPARPIIPTGAAFSEHGWTPQPNEITEFLRTAQELNLTAVNFWEWSTARSIPTVWKAIKDFEWPLPCPEKDITEKYIDALNSSSPEAVTALYTPAAVHITYSRTVQGPEAIKAWYQNLFTQLLPQAKYTLTGFTGTGNSRHLTWTATSPNGTVENGNDTFGLIEAKIAYHYTFFTISPI